MNVLPVLVVMLAFAGLAVLVSYQGLVAALRPVDAAWAALEAALERRHAAATELAAAVAARADEERATTAAITAALAAAAGTEGVTARAAAETELGRRLDDVVALAGRRSELRADAGIRRLVSGLAAIEQDIHVERAIYDACARTYTTRSMLYPSRHVAARFAFPERPPFELPERRPRALQPPV